MQVVVLDSCDIRTRAYKNGKTFDQCKQIAKTISGQLAKKIDQTGFVSWKEVLETVDHDEIVYKLTLKYLRQGGYNIGDWKTPEVKKSATV